MRRTYCTVPQCLYSEANPLIPLLAVHNIQSINVCTMQLSSTQPMGYTGFTEPQCLYITAKIYSLYEPYGQYRASGPV